MKWLDNFNKDRKQQLRLRRTFLAIFGAIAHLVMSILFFREGFFRLTTEDFIILFSLFWVVHFSFPILILTGINTQFRDPSMTVTQMVWAITCIMTTVYFLNQSRSLLLMFSLLILMFGAFRLNPYQFAFMVIFMILSYSLVIFLLTLVPGGILSLNKELLNLAMYSFVSIAFLVVGLEYSGLRNYLRAKEGTLKIALEKAEIDSITDPGTGTKNRRYLFSVLDRQKSMTLKLEPYHFSVCMFDIDHFKQINDKYGHAVGDAVLVEITQIFEGNLRKVDYFGRIGGEEFLLIAPFTTPEQLKIAGERYRTAVENASFDHIIPGLRVTVSIGATAYEVGESVDDLLNRADKALYQAKEGGRNKVVII